MTTIVWIFGTFVCLTYILSNDERREIKHSFWDHIGITILCACIWPVLLGCIVGEFLEKKDNEK